MSSINIIKTIDIAIRSSFNQFIDIVSNEFGIDKTKLIDLLNKQNNINTDNSDNNTHKCPYVPSVGKNKGIPCGKKCKKEFCYSHLPENIEKKKKSKDSEDSKDNSVNNLGNDVEEILNNLFIDWYTQDKELKANISNESLEKLINKKITIHEPNDTDNFEKDGYPISLSIANTKIRVNYEDGESLKKCVIPKNKSSLNSEQQTILHQFISSIENDKKDDEDGDNKKSNQENEEDDE
jgi:hypothetical protein